MKTYTTKVEKREEYFVTLPEELGIPEGTQFSIKEGDNGAFILTPFVSVEVDLPDEVFNRLALQAHNAGMTFNDYCIDLLQKYIERLEVTPDVG